MDLNQLRSADPGRWQTVADDLLTSAKNCEEAVSEIHANGTKRLEDSWPDYLGELVRQRVTDVTGRLEEVAVLLRGAVTALDTLEDAARTAQSQVRSAIDTGIIAGLRLVGDSFELPEDHADPAAATTTMDHCNTLIKDALDAANKADEDVAGALRKLNISVDSSSLEEARRQQGEAVQAALAAIRETLPQGQSPEIVAQWWSSLSDTGRRQLMLAVPVELNDLNGIPDNVKAELRGSNGYDAVKAVEYARDHWNDTSIDIFENNCANFVSSALHDAGLDEKGSSTLDSNGWMRSELGERHIDFDPPGPGSLQGLTHSDTWINAQKQKEFFLNNGGQEVGIAGARPGDVLYFEHTRSVGSYSPGDAHHTALVTAVLPNGDVLYTQHTTNGKDLSLIDRIGFADQDGGTQKVRVVRPKETW
ncbi:amidase domain-containing protein [Nocardia sp. CDC159]|uniref:Amidase domain-containing protein n=1 Tax=Nocardia pulmonis TaxID=2951408 RepID=A0A9X2J0L4_9NOCA|nr:MULTISPECIES: amidase domain-containing protein [Nocardia]MCM6777954.1 amidase domain-containing protein [Nocardia pulmonis]MCM6790875.1 amidase domain-containing protein [Nocardia sp. CDC159]